MDDQSTSGCSCAQDCVCEGTCVCSNDDCVCKPGSGAKHGDNCVCKGHADHDDHAGHDHDDAPEPTDETPKE